MAQSISDHPNPFDRRTFLTRSLASAATAASGAAVVASGGAVRAEGEITSSHGGRTCGFAPPSNALVTGVDPDELVLFAFDDYWLPFRQSLSLSLQQPTLCNQNPVLRLGSREEADAYYAALYGTVFRLGEKFRMWYSAVDNEEEFNLRTNLRLAYAESEDGIHWIKPKLGLREYRGNKENNLCDLNRECYNIQVLYDPDEPDANRRYKMTFLGFHHKHISADKKTPLVCVAFSSDGLRWTEGNNPVVPDVYCETSGLYRWNGIYMVNGQHGWPTKQGKRTMISFASADFVHWQEPYSVNFHRNDPSKAEGGSLGSQVHLGASIWHRRNVLLGLYGQWQGPPRVRARSLTSNLVTEWKSIWG